MASIHSKVYLYFYSFLTCVNHRLLLVPLTDPALTKLTIWTESSSDEGDYHPMHVKFGEVAVFHGSSCRHYVPMNTTKYTRMSLDFRVGIEGYFDSEWMMEGTTDDHSRRRVVV